jgi:hypothetical protein
VGLRLVRGLRLVVRGCGWCGDEVAWCGDGAEMRWFGGME